MFKSGIRRAVQTEKFKFTYKYY